jgi:hypothetical protein
MRILPPLYAYFAVILVLDAVGRLYAPPSGRWRRLVTTVGYDFAQQKPGTMTFVSMGRWRCERTAVTVTLAAE